MNSNIPNHPLPLEDLHQTLLEYPVSQLQDMIGERTFSNSTLLSALFACKLEHVSHAQILMQHLLPSVLEEDDLHHFSRLCTYALLLAPKMQEPMKVLNVILDHPKLTQEALNVLLSETYDSESAWGMLHHPKIQTGELQWIPQPPENLFSVPYPQAEVLMDGPCWWPDIMNDKVQRHMIETLTPQQQINVLSITVHRFDVRFGGTSNEQLLAFWSQDHNKHEQWWQEAFECLKQTPQSFQDRLAVLCPQWWAKYEKYTLTQAVSLPTLTRPTKKI